MKYVVLYDSVYGNTAAIAQSIGRGLGSDATVLSVANAHAADIAAVNLLVIGSPTLGGRPSAGMQAFLDRLPGDALAGVRTATFDTRMEMFIARLFGYAADRLAAAVKAHGAVEAAPAGGFIVKGREGPLRAGEEDRAAAWAQGIAKKLG
jgi:flavodoxin